MSWFKDNMFQGVIIDSPDLKCFVVMHWGWMLFSIELCFMAETGRSIIILTL